MKKLIISCSLLLMITFGSLSATAEEEPEFPYPHFAETNELCLECHDSIPKVGDEDLSLKFDGDILAICNRCHATISKDKYIHATGMIPSQKMIRRMPDNFIKALNQDPQGRVTCYVCHEMRDQCLSSEYYKREENRLFHRGGPYKHRTELCYNCHDRSKYKKFNPHNMINDEGELLTDVCTYCHEKLPDRRRAKSIADVTFKTDRYDMLCLRCHSNDAYAVGCVTGFEPDGKPIYHTGKPDQDMASRIKKSEKNAILPLALVTGDIFCGTCHNPHELGVQRRRRADVGADTHKRLRISKQNSRLCLGCHDDKDISTFEIDIKVK